MKIEQIYTGCLAQGAYYIESEGEAAIIDPLRETGPYIEKAKRDNASIKCIFETHFHADFVSGHLDLAKKTGARIVFGPLADTSYEKHTAKDGEIFQLGKVSIKVLHTPGHTPESTTYLLIDEDDRPHAIFTGDTLFIGDVGRPDLAQKKDEITAEDMAGALYDSLQEKIFPLPDDVFVYPAHGAGSACGKNMSKETWDTLGNQKKFNYALNGTYNKKDFIKELTTGLMPPPQYFAKNAKINKEGYESIDMVMRRGDNGLSPSAFEVAANETGAVILDVRDKADFVKGFIPNSIYIGIDGGFAPWVGALLTDLEQPILIVAPEGREEETVKRLARVGYDHTIGYLEGGFKTWVDNGGEVDTVNTIDAISFEQVYQSDEVLSILDVRKPDEFQKGHVIDAENFPLDFINTHMSEINRDTTYHIHCAGGYRATIASSILKARGFEHIVNVQTSFTKIKAAGIPVSENVDIV